MNVTYCDLCSALLKDGQSWMLYISSPVNPNKRIESREELQQYIEKISSEQKEICSSCYGILLNIFDKRLDAMAEMTKDCYNILKMENKKVTP